MRKTHKGLYKPKNPQKYAGNPGNIVYRSGWERRIMKEFDTNPFITKWASEELAIPYMSPIDGKKHRYFVDFVIEVKNDEVIMIEVKPHKETRPPRKSPNGKRKTFIREQMTYEINSAKWITAKHYCDDKGWKFWLIHEDNVNMYFPGVKFIVPYKKKNRKKTYK